MNKFNLDRFVDILKKEWSEYFRAYGISLIVWSCIPVLLWIATLVFDIQIDANSRGGFAGMMVFLAMMNVPEKFMAKSTCSAKAWPIPCCRPRRAKSFSA